MNLNRVSLPALDIRASVAFCLAIGFEPIVDALHYARFKSTSSRRRLGRCPGVLHDNVVTN
jgi:hypothetical protein